MKSDLQDALIYAHRANIARYQRLLLSQLADDEREFILRRLGDEENALSEITRQPRRPIVPMQHDPNPVMPHERQGPD